MLVRCSSREVSCSQVRQDLHRLQPSFVGPRPVTIDPVRAPLPPRRCVAREVNQLVLVGNDAADDVLDEIRRQLPLPLQRRQSSDDRKSEQVAGDFVRASVAFEIPPSVLGVGGRDPHFRPRVLLRSLASICTFGPVVAALLALLQCLEALARPAGLLPFVWGACRPGHQPFLVSDVVEQHQACEIRGSQLRCLFLASHREAEVLSRHKQAGPQAVVVAV
mmetsp:Transcript_21722/g.43098  ORF Transcript_21722/g.43098 Transcript_21722/m.43098 type:complete len:220 (-) Transcript_21722:1207-1866(-)